MSASAVLSLDRFATRPLSRRDPDISTEARRAVRLTMQAATAHSARLLKAATGIHDDILSAFAMKSGTGRARARDRILAAMPEAPLVRSEGLLIWRHIIPRDFPLERRDDRPGCASLGRNVVEVVGMVFGRLSRGSSQRCDTLTRAHRGYGLCVTDHASGRCVERSDMAPLQAVLLAHDALMTLTAADVGLLLRHRSWAVPAGEAGAWLCLVLPIIETQHGTELACSIIGQTFVSHDLMTPEQHAQCRLFGHRAPDYIGAALGMSVMRPPILPREVLQ